MKHLKLISLLSGLAMIAAPVFASINENEKIAKDETIVIVPLPDVAVGTPRTQHPFFAEYKDAFNLVLVGCNDASVGDVTVTISSSAGDWYQTVFDTSNGSILLPVSGESGSYTLTLVTSNGTTYIGEFVL